MGTPRQAPTLLRHIRRLATAQGLPQLSDRDLLRRFALERDEAAFAALVKRHGSMVLQVGMRVLHNRDDAEDIVQATFLVLTRKAGSLRWHESVGHWLYQAAYRIARKAKVSASRRVVKESRTAERPAVEHQDDLSWREAEILLDEELQRLPVKYRVPLVFCYLEGATRDEAAQQLGWSLSTLKRRLERGRELLRVRLVRRGLTFSAALFAPMLTQTTAKAALAPVLIQATVRTALQLAAGQPVAGLVSVQVAALVEGGLKSMLLTKMKMATAVLLVVSVVTGAGVWGHQALAGKLLASQATTAKPPQKSKVMSRSGDRARTGTPVAGDNDSIRYSGRVLGPDGKPVTGAKLYLQPAMGYPKKTSPTPESASEYGTTGPDGRFQFAVPRAQFHKQFTEVAATAANHGLGWVEVPAGAKTDDLTIHLVNDKVPITGRIVDLEGKSISGATLSVLQIYAAAGENLDPWLEAARGKKGLSLELEQQYFKRSTVALSPKATTDADGRFRLSGIGRNRLVRARLDGPAIVSQQLHILTRPGQAIEGTEFILDGKTASATTYYGSSFTHVAAPSKPIIGVVRDKDTSKPLAGVTIQSYKKPNNPFNHGSTQTTTDAQGRYRLTGMPKGEGNQILLIPRQDQPYVMVHAVVPDTDGLEPVAVDFDLKRAIWIEGKITDKVTGKPVRGSVEYFALRINANSPNLHEYPGFDGTFCSFDSRGMEAKEDGSYRVVGLPGCGLLAIRCAGHYLPLEGDNADGIQIIDADGVKMIRTTSPYWAYLQHYNTFARVDVGKGVDTARRDVTLEPACTCTGKVLGPDGKAFPGVRAFGLTGWGIWEPVKTAEFTVSTFNPRRPRDLLFQHAEKGLVGVAQPPKENGGSVTVQMTPAAVVKGRLVDANGKPRPDVELELRFHSKHERSDFPWLYYSPEPIKTDSEGRFRIEALLPDYQFRLSDDKGELTFAELRSGQTKDLGDVQLRRDRE